MATPEASIGGAAFSPRLLPTAPSTDVAGRFHGRFAATPEHVFTVVTVLSTRKPVRRDPRRQRPVARAHGIQRPIGAGCGRGRH
jgi:hypothetical protein